jgi:GNAT acetyltransferase-like protein
MISLLPCTDIGSILELKTCYLKSLVAPMDGMWETGFTDPAPHWCIRIGDDLAGYYAANENGHLLQFYLHPPHANRGREIFDLVIAQDELSMAVVSTIDPAYLSYCLEVQKGLDVHTYLYHINPDFIPGDLSSTEVDFRLVQSPELTRTIDFQIACLGGQEELRDWLNGYTHRLIERKELSVLVQGNQWLGLGEFRRSDTQKGVVDLGMMVSPECRSQGWATNILSRLAVQSKNDGLRGICSTTVENVASQKAIVRSGFLSRHRILNITL